SGPQVASRNSTQAPVGQPDGQGLAPSAASPPAALPAELPAAAAAAASTASEALATMPAASARPRVADPAPERPSTSDPAISLSTNPPGVLETPSAAVTSQPDVQLAPVVAPADAAAPAGLPAVQE